MNTALTPAGLVLSIASHGFSFNTKTSKVKKMYYLRSGSPWAPTLVLKQSGLDPLRK